MKAKLAALWLFIGLGACAAPQPPDVQLFIACKSYERALTALAALKPTLNKRAIETVVRTIDVADPLCRGGGMAATDNTVLAAVTKVRDALEQLVILRQQAEDK